VAEKRQRLAAAPARRYGGKSGQERADERREQLMAAGLALFGTEGYAAASVERICGEAGLIPRYFYESFRSREDLLVAVYDRIIDETEQRVRTTLLAGPPDPTARMARALRAFVGSYLDDPRRGRVVCLEVVGVSADLERHRREDLWLFAGIIDAEIRALARAGLLPKRDSRYGARALAGAMNELIIEWLTAPAPPAVRKLEREMLLFMLALFAGTPAALQALRRIAPNLR
jgi:AcrR family transcriptional regulator